MSAEGVLHAALLAVLRGAEDFGGALNGVFEGPAVKATAPYAEIGELLSVDWSTKDAVGRELRCAVTIRDLAQGPGRTHALVGACQAAVESVPRDLNGRDEIAAAGWVVRDGPGKWAGLIEYRVRMMSQGDE